MRVCHGLWKMPIAREGYVVKPIGSEQWAYIWVSGMVWYGEQWGLIWVSQAQVGAVQSVELLYLSMLGIRRVGRRKRPRNTMKSTNICKFLKIVKTVFDCKRSWKSKSLESKKHILQTVSYFWYLWVLYICSVCKQCWPNVSTPHHLIGTRRRDDAQYPSTCLCFPQNIFLRIFFFLPNMPTSLRHIF